MREATEFLTMYVGLSGFLAIVALIAIGVILYRVNPLKKIHLTYTAKEKYHCRFLLQLVFFIQLECSPFILISCGMMSYLFSVFTLQHL